MIKVCFPPGCYGSYLTRCIFNYTELNPNQDANFNFNSTGSSHEIRDNGITKIIYTGHLESGIFELPDDIITILPDDDHNLDYLNNQFIKQSMGEAAPFILTFFSIEGINNKLISNWGYRGQFDENIPKWIFREFCSLWIADVFTPAINEYKKVPARLQITTQNIFTDYLKTIQLICNTIQLTITADNDTILKNHSKFLNAQKFHNSQLNCKKWVIDLINGVDNLICPAQTIFDEAYIQYYLKLHGYEIQCYALNDFPKTTTEMNKIIYKL